MRRGQGAASGPGKLSQVGRPCQALPGSPRAPRPWALLSGHRVGKREGSPLWGPGLHLPKAATVMEGTSSGDRPPPAALPLQGSPGTPAASPPVPALSHPQPLPSLQPPLCWVLPQTARSSTCLVSLLPGQCPNPTAVPVSAPLPAAAQPLGTCRPEAQTPGQQPCPLGQAPERALETQTQTSLSLQEHPGLGPETSGLWPPALTPLLFWGPASPRTRLPISSSAISLPPPSPSPARHPAQELHQPATQAPSINNRSGPTDHSPTVGPPSAARACSEEANGPCRVSGQELQGGNTSFPQIGSRGAAGRLLGCWAAGQADGRLRAAGQDRRGAPVLTGGTRGNPSILHACNIQPSSEPVRSPASVGASAEPLRMGRPVGGLDELGAGAGLGPAP